MKKKKLDIENKLYISIKEEKGLEEIEKTILNIFDIANFDVEQTEIVTNLENIVKLENVRNLLKISKENIDNGLPIDLVEIDLKEALFLLGELLGIEVKSNLLDELFSRFCLGK